ncbi:nitrate reductase cytochrome c-type subunit [Reinekea marina]|uniref:Periplasmic nitrate reductase, electron transfer subunit n=1 Tax=Reinekea marina TaxID=1310421 RepID=A0ABV7WT84_9GAMM|nr:nitrate reductase cytochrome c-type subunit [Reinekea marina]MBU2862566.1 nitrate reductase cytochrome c-type subunit [Reinekea forsetii]MDN3648788.1 nitrate reductase cytochrome c-type subunit [Reinekea marina]
MKILATLVSLVLFASLAVADNEVSTLRGPAELLDNNDAPRMAKEQNDDLRRTRDYPMAPPTVPHKINGYQIDLNVNKCLSCHNRQRVADSQAPMISVTHFMNRDGNFLADVSPNRYFCTQCHASQLDVKPLLDNEFISMDEIIRQSGENH